MDKFHLLRIHSEFTAALEDSHSCAFQFHPPICTAKKNFRRVNSHVKLSTVGLWVRQFGTQISTKPSSQSPGGGRPPLPLLAAGRHSGQTKPGQSREGRTTGAEPVPSCKQLFSRAIQVRQRFVPVSGFGSSDYEWLQAVRTLTEFWDIGWGVWVVGWVQLWPAI